MAKSVTAIFLLVFVLSFAQSDEQAYFRNENERRWNTPPELTPKSVVKMSSNAEPQARLLSLIPVTATISLNAGHNNAHSVSLGANLDGISLSESNSYNHPTGDDRYPVSVSKSTTVAAGLSGISTASANAYNNGNNAKTESHSFNFGQAAATSFGIVENGRAITGAASSVGTSQSSAVSGAGQGQFFSQAGVASAQYPNRPTWNNVGPSNEHNDRRSGRPTLTISKPYEGRRPMFTVSNPYDKRGPSFTVWEPHEERQPSFSVWAPYDEKGPTLTIEAPVDTIYQQQKPSFHISKWQPNRGVFPRPSLPIEHHEVRPHESWNGQSHGSPSLQVSLPYGFSSSDSASRIHASPVDPASSSNSQAHISVYAPRNAQSSSHRNADERTQSTASSGYVSEDSSDEGRAKGTSASGYRGGSSVAWVNAQNAGNGYAQGGIASSEAGSFVSSPEGGDAQSQAVPLRHVGGKAVSRQETADSDIISDLVEAVGELFDVV